MELPTPMGFDLPPLLLLAIALTVILVLRSWNHVPANLPPFPGRRVPILGHLLLLGHKARDKMMELRQSTGEIFSMYFGSSLVIVLSSFDVVKEAVVEQADIFTDRPLQGTIDILTISTGIISTSGPTWKENRKTAFQILKNFGVGKDVMSQKINEEVKLYLTYLADLAGRADNVQEVTSCAVSNVTCNIVLGKRFTYDDSDFKHLLHSLDEYISLIVGGNVYTWFPQVKYLPGDLFKVKRLAVLNQELMTTMRTFIETIRTEETNGTVSDNLISSYIEKVEEKQRRGEKTELSLEQLERVLFDLVIGGSETTASTLMWFYIYMVHFPDVQQKIYEEIVREIGTNRSPTGHDKVRLSYVNAVILETQRISSIAPFGVPHRCTRETTVAGYTIPKDAQILLHLDSILLDDDVWGDARNFRPERFLKDGKLFCPEQFVVFGLGRRLCPGESLAKMELFLFTVSVIQRFQILPATPGDLPSKNYKNGGTCPPVPYKVRFVERDAP